MKRILCLLLTTFLVVCTTGCAEKETPVNQLRTPQYNATPAVVDSGAEPTEIHTADGGTKTISRAAAEPMSVKAAAENPDTIWENDDVATYNAYTMPEKAEIDGTGGSIGVLTIPKIALSVNAYESEDQMEDMVKGVAHFKSTSAYDGNVGLSGHNVNFDGSNGFFLNLHTLIPGDEITYETALGTRAYQVQTVKEIAEDDWSYLGRTTENKITLITCISNKPNKRLVVQAIEVK